MTYQWDAHGALLETNFPLPLRRGKVRDVYDLGEHLLIVSTDRISAFDYVLPVGIPAKGRYLTQLSNFWFAHLQHHLEMKHHLVSSEVSDVAETLEAVGVTDLEPLQSRIMITRRCQVVPFECVVRGYLEGSGWREYLADGGVCGIELPAGLKQCDRLDPPLFTPATKAEEGHDENISFAVMQQALGNDLATKLRELSLAIFQIANRHAHQCGLMIADTKFEFGHDENNQLILIDEVLTPDSSRFWDVANYRPGGPQPSYDKQFVREWLMDSDWDRNSPPPPLPEEIIRKTADKYATAVQRLTGEALA